MKYNAIHEMLFKAGDLRSVEDFIKATELSEMAGVMEENKERGEKSVFVGIKNILTI